MRKLIIGCGYLGCRVAELWRGQGADVCVVSRYPERVESYRRHGFGAVVADVTRPETLANLPTADAVLFAVGHDRSAPPSIAEVYAGGVDNVLKALPKDTGQFLYISTTGVYGTADGGWVDEQTPPAPQRAGGKASWAAEQVLAAHALGVRSAVLRLGGLYGPGRIPYLDRLRQGEPIAAPSAGWLNLIHVDDAAAVVVATDQWLDEVPAESPHLFCVCDGEPVVRGDYYREVARLIGAAPPKFSAPAPDSPAALRAGANRRVSNDKLKRTLLTKFNYPSYREGLTASLP